MQKNTQIHIPDISKEEILCRLLKREHQFYKEIFEITRRESEKLQSIDPRSDLQLLLKSKKGLLKSIREVEDEIQPLKKYWQSKTNRSDSMSHRIHTELLELNKLLKEILQLDLANQKILEIHLTELRAKRNEDQKKLLQH